ncbi:Methylated-DNA--protein-cysteine methyltransferase [Marinobacterium lacunae]|uniref:Methylated-DNA--protein-cysteine methyltransferase n=1 Tax=Marinobacterium lacunae TaxID=1232683 RepID=A0A081FWJ3_9GAMM|nr:methylated-DNA--[protein]-cysteine S-methyltransferase [Marinobacterium lacunae]KEA62898.1 Methylated-DNA--protein-cysteine methyltransferase [Marinobacterium lacunae]MBR9885535.1 methylated-DNA--[protein]-cysteine S-methyltransferase [Oceanospirillales bacterium]
MRELADTLLHLTDLPIGTLTLLGNDHALTGVEFGRVEHPSLNQVPNDLLLAAAHQLSEYFAGTRREFDLPLAPIGSPFQQSVWEALCEIPFGETRSYGDLAHTLGRPRAARAVGMANNRNPIAIIIPCHRVLGADGKLVGYAGGLIIKQTLLRLEGALD